MSPARRAAILGGWLCFLLLAGLVVGRSTFVSDMSAFMPKVPNARQQLLVDQLRDGFLARLMMIGIEGGDAAGRARLSLTLAERLRSDPAFVSIQNGDAATTARDADYLIGHRYLLSPAVTPERFAGAGLHGAIADSIDTLTGDAGLLFKQVFARDPTGELQSLLGQFSEGHHPSVQEGAWSSTDGRRAVLLAETRAAGSDTEGQARALERLRRAFADAAGIGTQYRLLTSGAGVISVESRDAIEGQAGRLAFASLVLVVTLLMAIYRSWTLLLIGMIPVVSGALAGIAAVSLAFGSVHGLTLGFGTTLIGEAVDYSIYFFLQRFEGGHSLHFWKTLTLGTLTSMVGFATLLVSGFPGLAQLGLYSVTGLAVAGIVTRLVLPAVAPTQAVPAAVPALGRWLGRVQQRLGVLRWLILAAALAAFAVLLTGRDHIWNRQLSALSPISQERQRLDSDLRNDLGAPESQYLAAFSAPDRERALEAAEAVGTRLQGLVDAGALGGFVSPTVALPSDRVQGQRRAALPEPRQLQAELARAVAGLPVRAETLQPFLADVERARNQAPIGRADLDGTSFAFLVDALVVPRAHDVLVLLPIKPPVVEGREGQVDLARVRSALVGAGLPAVTVIDMLAEATDVFDNYLHEALRLTMAGALAIAVLLFLWLRSPRRVVRVLLPLATSVVCVAGGMVALGIHLTILHLVGLLLLVALGSNYALFFDAQLESWSAQATRHNVLASLVIANATTVISFGVLGTSVVPVLSAIGTTVASGAFLALLSAAAFNRPAPDAHA